MALLCSLFEYDITLHPCVFLLVSSLFLTPLLLLSLKMITLTRKLSPGARAKVMGLVTLDGCVGLCLHLAIWVVLVQQRRARNKEEDVIIEAGDREIMVIREVARETDV